MRLWLEVARRSFRQISTYRVATASGVFVNTVFGFIRAAVLVQVARSGGGDSIRDISAAELITFSFVSQGLMPMTGVFGFQALAARITGGDIAVDFYRPIDLQLWWSAVWGGQAAFQLLARGVPPVLVAAAFYDLVWPPLWALPSLVVAVILATGIGFALRYLTNLATFWLLDSRGVDQMMSITTMFFAGILVPLNLFPAWLEPLARRLPFAAMVQVPVEVFLGRYPGTSVVAPLAWAALWLVVLIAAGRAVQATATHRVVVQGG